MTKIKKTMERLEIKISYPVAIIITFIGFSLELATLVYIAKTKQSITPISALLIILFVAIIVFGCYLCILHTAIRILARYPSPSACLLSNKFTRIKYIGELDGFIKRLLDKSGITLWAKLEENNKILIIALDRESIIYKEETSDFLWFSCNFYVYVTWTRVFDF